MVSRKTALRWLPLALTLTSCVSSPDDVSDDVSAQRRKWQSQQITSYRVQSSLSCFCIREATEPVLLEVRNRALVSVTRVSDGAPVPPSEWADRYYTVDEMFVLIASAERSGADEVRVSYDPRLGYPTQVFIDQSQQLADEERWFELAGLSPTR
jgi:hypothetical protein